MKQNAEGETQLWKEISRSATSIGESEKKEETKRGRRDLQLCLNGGQCVYLTRKKKVSEVSEREKERERDENIWGWK